MYPAGSGSAGPASCGSGELAEQLGRPAVWLEEISQLRFIMAAFHGWAARLQELVQQAKEAQQRARRFLR